MSRSHSVGYFYDRKADKTTPETPPFGMQHGGCFHSVWSPDKAPLEKEKEAKQETRMEVSIE